MNNAAKFLWEQIVGHIFLTVRPERYFINKKYQEVYISLGSTKNVPCDAKVLDVRTYVSYFLELYFFVNVYTDSRADFGLL